MRTDLDQPGHFRLDVQIGVLAEKRQAGDANVVLADLFEFGNVDHIFEPAILQKQLQRGVLQVAAAVAGHHNGLHLVANLQQSFKKDVILMVVGDQKRNRLIREDRDRYIGKYGFRRYSSRLDQTGCWCLATQSECTRARNSASTRRGLYTEHRERAAR